VGNEKPHHVDAACGKTVVVAPASAPAPAAKHTH